MNNGEILSLIFYITATEQSGNELSPTDFTSILQSANLKYFKLKVDNPSEYKVGVPVSRQSADLTEQISNSLLPFKVLMDNTTTPMIVANGTSLIPSDFYKRLSLSYLYMLNGHESKLKAINVLTDDQWDRKIGSALSPPSMKSPIANFQNGFIRFRPLGVSRVNFSYLRYPKTPVYDYYIDATGDYIYLPEGVSYKLQIEEEGSQGQLAGTTVISLSQELEWNDVDKIDIISFILRDIGINLKDDELQKYAQEKIATGV